MKEFYKILIIHKYILLSFSIDAYLYQQKLATRSVCFRYPQVYPVAYFDDFLKLTMENSDAVRYQIVINEETVERISNYKEDLTNGKAVAGKYLKGKIFGLDLSKICIYEFIDLLLSTKKPEIFSGKDVKCDGTDWSSREFALLGDINVAVKVLAYDNGAWNEKNASKHDKPLDVELLFTPGALLQTMNSDVENNPDYKEVVENGKINQENYYALVQRRLLPLFTYVNNQAENGKKALVVLPGIGCGFFAGIFKGQMESKLDKALQGIIEKHKFPNIKGIYLGFHGEQPIVKKEINGVIYEVRGNCLPQLSEPQEYGKEFRDCKLYKVVAWDHVSLPGNNFFVNNRRFSDDGVSAAATNLMEIITGIKGMYREGKYFPPEEYADWEAVAMSNHVKLVANKSNTIIVSQDGNIMQVKCDDTK